MQLRFVIAAFTCAACALPVEDDVTLAGAEQALAAESATLWAPDLYEKKTVVPVCFNNGSSDDRRSVKAIIENTWQRIDDDAGNYAYGVDFTGWASCPANPKGRFVSIQFDANLDVPGRAFGLGRTSMAANPSMRLRTTSYPVVVHEFGHILGFSHEFKRSDFDPEYPCEESDGEPADVSLTGVDVASIMNYASCGAGGDLSQGDKEGFKRVYGPMSVHYAGGSRPSRGVYLRHSVSLAFVEGSTRPTFGPKVKPLSKAMLLSVASPTSQGAVRYGDELRISFPSGALDSTATPGARNSPLSLSTDLTRTTSIFKVSGGPVGQEVLVNDEISFTHKNSGLILVTGNGTQLGSGPLHRWRILSAGGGHAL